MKKASVHLEIAMSQKGFWLKTESQGYKCSTFWSTQTTLSKPIESTPNFRADLQTIVLEVLHV